jgi:toxin ParE1/3/4
VRIVWSTESVGDLEALRALVDADDPAAAQKMIRRIAKVIETSLPQNPETGRRGRAPERRELVVAHTPSVVAYRRRDETIEILRVFHEARRWPDRP